MTRTIAGIATRLVPIPLTRPWGLDVTTIHVIVVEVTASDGATGYGFSWTPSIGAASVKAMLDHDLASKVVGMPADPAIWDELWSHLHEGGGGGVTTIALAGIDLALWDLECRAADQSIIDRLGRRRDSQPAYGSGINRHYTIDELVTQAQRWVDAGFDAVKIKIGLPDLDDDLARVGRVRDVIGPDRELMVDANQLWNLDTATTAAEHLEQLGVAWLEEPLRADDTAGHAELRRRTSIPIAVGENAHTWYRFADLITAGACDIVQPNIVRVGGITPFLRIVDLAREHGVTMGPHLLPELSAPVAMTLPEPAWIEDVEDARFEQLGVLAAPTGTAIANGAVTSNPPVGLGILFTN